METKRELARRAGMVCIAIAFGLLTACGGGGGGGGGQPDASKYSGVTTRASLNTSNAVAFTTEAFAVGSIGASTNIVGVMVPLQTESGSTTTVAELAEQVRGSLAARFPAGSPTATVLPGVVSTETVSGAVGGSAVVTIDLQPSGSFTGKITFSSLQNAVSGPVVSGTVTVSGVFNQANGSFDSLTMTFSPLSATTSTGTISLYGTFVFASQQTGDTLTISCTMNVSGKTYWLKDWTYTYTPDNRMTIAGAYYHPTYGYAELTTPTPLTVSSMSAYPTAGVFQAAGGHCSKAKLTFSSAGSTVTVIGGDNQNWELCSE